MDEVKINNTEILTEQEVEDVLKAWDFLEFSRNYRGEFYGGGYYTPETINRQMQNSNMNPVNATVTEIEKALRTPKDSEKIIRDYATSIETQNMYYKRLIRFISDMPCFNLNFIPTNIQRPSEYKSKEFKSDLAELEDFCNKFNFKEEFSVAMRQMLRQGIFYCVLRDDGDKYILQELPPDYCIITGRHSHGLLYDFNMAWFLSNYGVDINMYPKIFKKMYRRVFQNIDAEYTPSGSIDKRTGSFAYWHQTSPDDGFWAWKVSPELATVLPYYSPLFPEMSMQPVVRNLQSDKYFIEASKLLVGIIGMNKENKTGNVNNQINITPDILGKFLGIARQGLAKQVGLTALPMDDIKAVEFDTKERNMLTEYIKNISDQSVSASAALLDDNKLNVHQSKLALAIDENFINSMYSMFSNFVEFYVNKRTKKYKFKISFHDTNTPDNKTERINRFKNMSQMGIVDFQDVSRIYDVTPFEMKRKMEMSNNMGFTDNLMYIAGYNQSKDKLPGSNGRGRPAIDNPDNENTAASQAHGSNELKEGI